MSRNGDVWAGTAGTFALGCFLDDGFGSTLMRAIPLN